MEVMASMRTWLQKSLQAQPRYFKYSTRRGRGAFLEELLVLGGGGSKRMKSIRCCSAVMRTSSWKSFTRCTKMELNIVCEKPLRTSSSYAISHRVRIQRYK